MSKLQTTYDAVALSAHDGDLLANMILFATELEVAALTRFKGKLSSSHLRQAQSALGLARNPQTVAEGISGARLAIKKLLGAGMLDDAKNFFDLEAMVSRYEKSKIKNQGLAMARASMATATLQQAIHELMGGPITEVSIRCDHTSLKDRTFNGNREFIYSVTMGEKLAQTISQMPISTALREIPVWLKAASVERDADGKAKLNSDIGMQILPTWMNRVAARVEVLMTNQNSMPSFVPPPPVTSTPGASTTTTQGPRTRRTAQPTTHAATRVVNLTNAYRFGSTFYVLLERMVATAQAVPGRIKIVSLPIDMLFQGTGAKDERRMLGRMKVNGQANGLWSITIGRREVTFEIL